MLSVGLEALTGIDICQFCWAVGWEVDLWDVEVAGAPLAWKPWLLACGGILGCSKPGGCGLATLCSMLVVTLDGAGIIFGVFSLAGGL